LTILNKMKDRFLSLDAFRGLTMFLLAGEAALMYESLSQAFPEGNWLHGLVEQFHHHPWAGLRFWDLIQPFFMFIVGVAMPFSLRSRLKRGDTWGQSLRHILWRSLLLFLFGTGLHCVYSGKLVFELWNVLTQLSFTIPVTFLLMRTPWKVQLSVSFLLLAITEVCYRAYAPAAPFVMDQNFGSMVDMLLMGKLNNGGGWVTFNCVPTAAHTIWGALCGSLLLSDAPELRRVKILVTVGIIGLAIGFGLHWAGITPIVKRISTTAFVFASGGWALLALALFYWLIDIKEKSGWTFPFVVVGMNSIFIYLFFETVGVQWLVPTVRIFNDGFLGALGLGTAALAVINSLLVWGIYWGLCKFLYKHKIFIKI
jgi:predicted acyltransferase